MTPRRLRSRAPELGAALLLAVLCAACGGSDDGEGVSYKGSSRPLTRVVVTLTPSAGADSVRTTLDCPESAGCDELLALDPEVLRPVDGRMACAEMYGGSQMVTLQGMLRGEKIDATFTRTADCEIQRFDELVPLLKAADLV